MTDQVRKNGGNTSRNAGRLADYAIAFDFLGRLSDTTTEKSVVETVFELFSMLFAPNVMVYLSVVDGKVKEVISLPSGPIDLDVTKNRMLQLDREYSWTPSGRGFDFKIGQGAEHSVIEVDGIAFSEYREHYLNLVLNVAPVLNLALHNARTYQLLANAISARDTILAVVSHDLRSPLRGISISAGMIDRRLPQEAKDEELKRHLRLIREAVKRMDRLIGNLLDLTRIESGIFSVQTTECTISDLLDETLREIRPQAENNGVRLEMKCASDLRISCDRDRLLQVFSNLLANAIKFVPGRNGLIAVSCEETENNLRFLVSDNGPGIQAEELPHVFDRFWQGRQKKRGGLGLGLAIAQGIIRAHGGEIWIESVFGHGARFYFTLPKKNCRKNESQRIN